MYFLKAIYYNYIKYENNFAQSHKSEFRRTIQKEIMNVEHSWDKQNDGIGDRLDVPFIFNRTTDIGQIKLGDIFFYSIIEKNYLHNIHIVRR